MSPQPPNLDPMAYVPIAKLDNFTGKEDNTQSLVNKPQDFNAFKAEFLKYFSNNNSINCLVNTFTTMKQGEMEAVTTYLGCFYQNLHQIQAIDTNYFTAPQILNQFIHGLHSSILQHVHPLHPGTFQNAVTHTRDFESAESEANHAQAVNLIINGSSELDSKLEKFRNSNCAQNQPCPSSLTNQQWQQEMRICYYCGKQEHIQIDCCQRLNNQQLRNQYQNPDRRFQTPNHDAIISLSVSNVSSSNLLTAATKLEIGDSSPSTNSQFFTAPSELHHFLVTPEDTSTNNLAFTQKQPLTSNISPATITKNKSLAVIFPFKFKKTTAMPLFSGAALEAKPITVMYTNVKVKRQSIKLIFDSGSADSIIT
ncbi:hypothetical protein G9A89_019968 [Geosiphon pyriformis]|nr:hypothetical protein G9A89_019968 [Geosiphon pyriformis]